MFIFTLMKKRDAIYHLVGVMNEAEKNHFIKYGFKNNSGESGKLQLKLFKWLSANSSQDEERIRLLFFKNDPDKYRIVKHHLFNRILDTLTELQQGSGIEGIVNEHLSRARTLISKGMNSLAEHFAIKAYSEALVAERYDLAYSTLELQKECLSVNILNEQLYKRLHEIALKKNECLQKLMNLNAYQLLFDRLKLVESRTGNMDYTPAGKEKELDLIRSNKHLLAIEEAQSFEARCIYFLCKSYLCNADKKHAERSETAASLVRHLESAPDKMKYYQSKYRAAVNQYLNTCFSTGKFDDFDTYLEKLIAGEKGLAPRLAARNFLIVENLRMNKNFALGKVNENLSAIQRIEQQLPQHINQLNATAFQALYANCMITYFHEGKHRESLVYINKILHVSPEGSHATALQMAMCLNCIVHYELNNNELLHYLLRTYRTKKYSQPVLSFIISVIPLLLNQRTDRAKIENLWHTLQSDPAAKKFAEDIYLHKWIEKRIRRS